MKLNRIITAKLMARVLPFCLVLGLSACSPVAPWERGRLAQPQMALEAHPLQSGFRSHSYSAREAATGSSSAEGGGCGCY